MAENSPPKSYKSITKNVKEKEKRLLASDEQFMLLLQESRKFVQTQQSLRPKERPTEATAQTEELYKQYIMESTLSRKDTPALTKLSASSLLRYVTSPKILFDRLFHNTDVENSLAVAKGEFIFAIQETLGDVFSPLPAPVSASISEIFEFFAEGNPAICPDELVGLILLCGGKLESKMQVTFEYLNTEGGILGMDEFKDVLVSVFKLLIGINPGPAKATKVTISEMAEMAVYQCFEDMKCNGYINADTFIKWCNGVKITEKAPLQVLTPVIFNNSADQAASPRAEHDPVIKVDKTRIPQTPSARRYEGEELLINAIQNVRIPQTPSTKKPATAGGIRERYTPIVLNKRSNEMRESEMLVGGVYGHYI